MAEYKVNGQVNTGWGLTLQMAGKTPAVAKRIFDTLANAQAYVNDVNDTALPGLLISVIKDAAEKNNGVYFVRKASGYDGLAGNKGELVKVGSGETVQVSTYAEAKALATVDTLGQLVYLTKEDTITTPGTTYNTGLYVVTGANELSKLGTFTAGSTDLAGDVATLKGEVASLKKADETLTTKDTELEKTITTNRGTAEAHYANKKIHVPEGGAQGQILYTEADGLKWKAFPTAGTALGGIKNGGDITISQTGEVTVTKGDNHTHKANQITDFANAWSTELAKVKGKTDGLASLDGAGKIPSTQLPSYVDDVIEIQKVVAAKTNIPSSGLVVGQIFYATTEKKLFKAISTTTVDEGTTPEAGKIYIAIDDSNKQYRWAGPAAGLVQITSGNLVIGTAAGNAFDGAEGKKLQDAVAILNGSQSKSGSVAHTAKGIVDTAIGNLNLSETYATKAALQDVSKKATTNADAITTLNGSDSVVGSVANKIKTAKAEINKYTVNNISIDSSPVLDTTNIKFGSGYTGSIAKTGDTLNVGIAAIEKQITEINNKAGVASLNGLSGSVVISSTDAGKIAIAGTGSNTTVAIAGWNDLATKASVDALSKHTVNGIVITENPILDGADIVLDGYVKPDIETVTAISVSDTVNAALGKLEAKIDNIKPIDPETINNLI